MTLLLHKTCVYLRRLISCCIDIQYDFISSLVFYFYNLKSTNVTELLGQFNISPVLTLCIGYFPEKHRTASLVIIVPAVISVKL